MRMMKFVLVALAVFGNVICRAGEVVSGRVATVIDGNTIEVKLDDNETYKIMLHGIDCPELAQAYGEKAKQFLEKILLDKSVSVELKGKDRWGTRLGVILIDGELDPRLELLKAGLAWTAEVSPNPAFEGLKERARE